MLINNFKKVDEDYSLLKNSHSNMAVKSHLNILSLVRPHLKVDRNLSSSVTHQTFILLKTISVKVLLFYPK